MEVWVAWGFSQGVVSVHLRDIGEGGRAAGPGYSPTAEWSRDVWSRSGTGRGCLYPFLLLPGQEPGSLLPSLIRRLSPSRRGRERNLLWNLESKGVSP